MAEPWATLDDLRAHLRLTVADGTGEDVQLQRMLNAAQGRLSALYVVPAADAAEYLRDEWKVFHCQVAGYLHRLRLGPGAIPADAVTGFISDNRDIERPFRHLRKAVVA